VDIDILCKVVDNYGDIGVVFRLARALSELPERPRLRLVVDELRAYAAVDPSIDPSLPVQLSRGWEVYPWEGPGIEAAREAFKARPPRIVLECFACGRPDWLEELLFDPASAEPCLILDLEYLSAEPYADEFHRMPSLTRSKLVRKAMFLPGFTPGTGGLIVDRSFASALRRSSGEDGRLELRRDILARLGGRLGGRLGLPADSPSSFWTLVFSYERDYSRIVADLAAYASARPLLALAAAGKSQDCFLRAWEAAGRPFPALALPFLAQEAWDELLAACDFTIVRGEDSWSRAALSGRPFLWQAYPQDGRYQMVKVRAFLDRLKAHFAAPGFACLEALYLAFNDRDRDESGERGEESLLPALSRYPELLEGFRAFSASLAQGGNLAANLVTFLGEIV
jgi:uncharacterized repeat protein (TIGR03837 family)